MPDETQAEVTKTGRVLTDADFEALADEAEHYDADALIEHLTHRGTAKQNATLAFERACTFVALVFGADSPQRAIAIKARGDMREANGEART
jgi:hypothetical protein